MKKILGKNIKVGDIIYDVPGGLRNHACGEVLKIQNNYVVGARVLLYIIKDLNRVDTGDSRTYSLWFNDKITIIDQEELDLLLLQQ